MGNQSLHVLRGVDMDIESGELVSIMGASGSGKSTLLNIIGILDDMTTATTRSMAGKSANCLRLRPLRCAIGTSVLSSSHSIS